MVDIVSGYKFGSVGECKDGVSGCCQNGCNGEDGGQGCCDGEGLPHFSTVLSSICLRRFPHKVLAKSVFTLNN